MSSLEKQEEQKNPTMQEVLENAADRYGQRDAFRWLDGGRVQAVSFIQFAQEVRALAAALAAQTQPDAHIAIVSGNSYRWLLSWFAILSAGRVAIHLDVQQPTAVLHTLLKQSETALLFYAQDFTDVAQGFPNAVCLDGLPELLAPYAGVEGWPCKLQPDKLASIVFSSGTTGEPKGVQLSHRNWIASAIGCGSNYDRDGAAALSVLPLHHAMGIDSTLSEFMGGTTVCICAALKYFARDMLRFQPDYSVIVPQILERMHQGIWQQARKNGREKQLRLLLKVNRLLMALHIDLRRKLFTSVHKAFGGNFSWAPCGGAPVPDELVDEFYQFGIEILPAYGLTECAPIVAKNIPGTCMLGTVGAPTYCNQIRIADPTEDGIGEIQVRGSNVFSGYFQDPQATHAAFTTDGWFRTGDLGAIRPNGFLSVTGRIKNLIILSNGKNVSPEPLEQKLGEIPAVQEVVVYAAGGEITAEVFLNESISDAAAQFAQALLAINRQLPVFQRITKTVLRDREFPKTTSQKIKRN